jgi:hypothetical protein
MDPVTAAFIIAMIEIVAKYGIPGFQAIMAAWNKEIVTLEDIQALAEMAPPPESYFPPAENERCK